MNDLVQSGWQKTTVGDLAQVKGGKRLPAGSRLQVQPTPFPYIRVTDMFNGGVKESEIRYVPETAALVIQNFRIRSDDIFISVAGTLGIVGRVSERLDGANLTENADMLTNIKCDVDYLMYFLLSELVQKEIDSIRTVGAQPKLALGKIKTFPISLPSSKVEQVRVSKALRDVDLLISSLRLLIEKKREIKQGMLQQLLSSKYRLPGFTANWIQKPLNDLCDLRSGTPKQKQSGGAHWIVDMGSVTREAKLKVTKKTDDISGQLRPGELVMPKDDIGGGQIIGRTSLIPDAGIYVLADHVYALTPIGVNPEFLNLAINSARVNKELRSKVTGSAQLGLSRKSVLEQIILLPESLDEQEQIATVFREINLEEEALEQELLKVLSLKQGMMQELLTGRTRLTPTGE